MKEYRNAEEAVAALMTSYEIIGIGDRTPRFINWAPGDFTKYLVALLEMRPIGDSRPVSKVTMLFVSCGEKQLFLRKPQMMLTQYSADHFLRSHGDDYAGWWSGLRPLLAGLGWTPSDERSTVFDTNDAVEMGTLLQRH